MLIRISYREREGGTGSLSLRTRMWSSNGECMCVDLLPVRLLTCAQAELPLRWSHKGVGEAAKELVAHIHRSASEGPFEEIQATQPRSSVTG